MSAPTFNTRGFDLEPHNLFDSCTGCLKKTEFCQIEHLQILLVFGEKYLMKFVANPVVSCFESAISMLLLGAWRIQPWGHTGSGKGH